MPAIETQHAVVQSAFVVHVGSHEKAPLESVVVHDKPVQQCWVPPHGASAIAHWQALASAQKPPVLFAYGTQHFVEQSLLVAHGVRQPA